MMLFISKHRVWLDQEGAAALEFAILLPVVVLTLILSTDYALSVLAKVQVEAAARAGAQSLAINGYNVTQITNAVLNAIPNPISAISLGSISVECATTDGGTYTPAGGFNPNAACSTAGAFPYGTITANISYRPLFSSYWNGQTSLPITGSATTRFQ